MILLINDIQALSLLFLMGGSFSFTWILITQPKRRLLMIPFVVQSVGTMAFYLLLLSRSFSDNTALYLLVSAALRLQEAVLLFGVALLLIWKPDKDGPTRDL